MRNQITWISISLLIGSCSTSSLRSEEKAPPPDTIDYIKKAPNSSITIDYVLGHDQYRFQTESNGKSVAAATYLDEKVLEKGQIDQAPYTDFLKKAYAFLYQTQKAPLDSAACRSPFTIKIRLASDNYLAHGCRSASDSSFSKLLREGQFLLSSEEE